MSLMDLFCSKTASPSYIGFEINCRDRAAGFFFKTGDKVENIAVPLTSILPIIERGKRKPVEIKNGGYVVPYEDLKDAGLSIIHAQHQPYPTPPSRAVLRPIAA